MLFRSLASDVSFLGLEREIVVVNDCSKDATAQELERYAEHPTVRVFHHDVNQGKGAALRTGFKLVLKNNLVFRTDAVQDSV